MHLKKEPHLVLQYGHDLPIPIPDLHVDEHGVTATLSFARCPQPTFVPWDAVYVVASDDGRGVLYPEDVPPDVSVIAARADGEPMGGEGMGEGAVEGEPFPPASPNGDVTGPGELVRPATSTPTRALRAVPLAAAVGDDGIDMPEDAPAAERMLPARRRRRPQLRLVK